MSAARPGPGRFTARLYSPVHPPEPPETLVQFRRVSLETLAPILLVSIFIGATATLMGYHAFRSLGTQAMIGAFAGLVALRELAPLLAGAMIAAKPGTAFTAAIATMRETEQIDALEVMGVDPFRHLLAPRALALVLAAPALVVFADMAALAASFATAVLTLGVAPVTFMADMTRFVGPRDLGCGVIKVLVFAALAGVIATYHGYTAAGGPRGVSRAVTRGMVATVLAIVAANMLLSEIFYGADGPRLHSGTAVPRGPLG